MKTNKKTDTTLRVLLSLLVNFKRPIIILTILLFVMEVVRIFIPFAFGNITEIVAGDNPAMEPVIFWSIVGIISFSLMSTLEYLQSRIELKDIDWVLPHSIFIAATKRMIGLSIGQMQSSHSGFKQSVINRGANSIRNVSFTILYNILPVLVQMFVATVVLIFIAPIIGWFVAGFTIIVFTMMYLLNPRFTRDFPELIKLNNIHNKRISDLLKNLSLVKVTSQMEKIVNHLDTNYKKQHRVGIKIFTLLVIVQSIQKTLSAVFRFFLIALSAYFVIQGGYEVGTFVTILFLLQWSTGSYEQLSRWHRSLVVQWQDVDDFVKLYRLESDVKIVDNPILLTDVRGKITFSDVTYKYPREKGADESSATDTDIHDKKTPSINDVSFVINPGEKVAFVGPSGAGKTTLLKLMLRAMDPQSGMVSIDEVSLRDLDPEDWYHHIGLVDQEVNILDVSIRDNLLLGLQKTQEHLSDEDLKKVLVGVGLEEFKSQLDRKVGEKGIKLSGGQRQRIAIARCLLRDAGVFFIDEATSNLDAHSEYVVTQTLNEVTVGKTVVFVAHRLATIKNVDRIYYIDGGKIIDNGTHEELKIRCKQYASMVERQSV